MSEQAGFWDFFGWYSSISTRDDTITRIDRTEDVVHRTTISSDVLPRVDRTSDTVTRP